MQNKLWFIFISEMQPTKKNAVFLGCVENNSYICSIATEPLGARRAVLYMRKTFSKETDTYAFFVS